MSSKFPKLGWFATFWKAITSFTDLWLRWGLKKSCNPHQKLSKDMWHAICIDVCHGDSWLLMGRSQIGILIPNLSFGHNFCFKYSNGSCEPILNIYVPRIFQWYKEFFNPMGFGPWNTSLKIQDSIGIRTLKVGVHLGVCGFIPSHSRECKCDSWVALSACTFSCLCFGRKPKIRIVIITNYIIFGIEMKLGFK
jgi:hypothetical protein